MFRNRLPELRNPNIRLRVAHTPQEIDVANQLIYRNYVDEGFWKPDTDLRSNKTLHSPHREVFVAMDGAELVGTVSLIRDSPQGLPSDEFQPEYLRTLRSTGEKLGEISCLAIDKAHSGSGRLIFFLIKYYMQYSFYHAAIDRLVKACRPEHGDFYADVLRFDKIGPVTYCEYARRPSQLLSANLLRLHRVLHDYYQADAERTRTLYHFFLVDEHPNLIFPAPGHPMRPRLKDWRGHGALQPPSRELPVIRKRRAIA